MASIQKRNNSYLIRVSDGYDIKGKQHFKSMTWRIPPGMSEKKAEKEARHQAALFEERVRQGNVLDGNIKLSDFIERWFRDFGKEHLRKRTYDSYQRYTVRVNQHLGHIRLDKLRPHHLNSFYSKLREPIPTVRYKSLHDFKAFLKEKGLTQQKAADISNVSLNQIKVLIRGNSINHGNAEKISKGLNTPMDELFALIESEYILSGKTILNYHRFISSVLSWAVKWEAIPYNPAERVAAPKAENIEAPHLAEDELELLLDKIEHEEIKYRTLIYVALHLGARRAELLGLKWSNIDLENHTIGIRRTVLYTSSEGVFVDGTKTPSSKRVVKVYPGLIELLEEYKKWQNEERKRLGDKWIDDDWVFPTWNGRYMNPDMASEWVTDFAQREGIPNLTLQTLRHTNASFLLRGNTDPRTVAARLGHSNPTTTLKIYSHIIKSRDAAAAEALGEVFSKKPNK